MFPGPGIKWRLGYRFRQLAQRPERELFSDCEVAYLFKNRFGHGLFKIMRNLAIAMFYNLGPPIKDQFRNRDLYRADSATGTAMGAGIRQARIFIKIIARFKHNAYGPHISGVIADAGSAAKNGACIHAGAAAHAFEHWPVIAVGKPAAAPIIKYDQMHFLAFSRPVIM